MPFLILALVLALCCPVAALGADSTLTRAPDGTLVLRRPGGSGDAVSPDLTTEQLSREVQVYIYRQKTIVPRVINLKARTGPSRVQANPYIEALIQKYSRLHGVDPHLVRALVRHESGFNPQAVSPKGAKGLMQLMPGTAALMGVTNPFDPDQNIRGGVGYLRLCLDRFNQNVPLAVAAYNAGPEAVTRYRGIPPYSETQVFVQNVLGTYTGGVATPSRPRRQVAARAAQKGVTPQTSSPPTEGQAEAQPEAPRRARPRVIEIRPGKKPKTTAKKP